MKETFLTELAETGNKLIGMLCDCEFEIVEYVLQCINNDGYIFLEDLQKIDKEL